MHDDDILHDFFGGHVYWMQRADIKKKFGLSELILSLALYSDGIVVTSSGGK